MESSILQTSAPAPEAASAPALGLLDYLADDLLDCLLERLAPLSNDQLHHLCDYPSREAKFRYAENSQGAAHLVQLCKTLASRTEHWRPKLLGCRRSHHEILECCRVLEAFNEDREDWPLEVLRLRGSGGGNARAELSHITPIARQVLRLAYWAVARDVHPDRHSVPQATQAMSVLNEAYRRAMLLFSHQLQQDIVVVDQQGLNHLQPHLMGLG
ncbi:hypothetical protein AB1Y20_006714 [Prymnesium parvum]|uniref:Uncharacterized protein n=1 Tax=Prymnesium parvum TaxID=97485 RepID=A0AB34IZN0_PRYPA|mmetsp:Transcript_4967/g.12219  ORF Transcript_4967/g.12219 Transcript_4967/m.12219 type:complete len:214 (+) Transcript_4967:3-644(+)